jgi:peroxiredoxin
MIKNVLLILFIAALYSSATFESSNGYKVGDNATDFKLKNVDGKMVSLSDYSSAKGFIVIFTCNTCPYAKLYEDRINELNQVFLPKGYPVIAINPNDPNKSPGDSFEAMKKRSAEKKFTFPYLLDETQMVTASFGATHTPQVYVLRNAGGKYKVSYIGAIDNNHKDKSLANEKYVENAVNQLISGREVLVKNTKAIGCTIKWKN